MSEKTPNPAPRRKLEPVDPPPTVLDTVDVEPVPDPNPERQAVRSQVAAEVRPAVEPSQTRRYRCYNCHVVGSHKLGFDFVGPADLAAVACPSCGIEASGARGSQLIQTVAVIHFEPPAVGNRAATFEGSNKVRVRGTLGSDRVACPAADDGSAQLLQLRRTGEPSAVTCPACIGSEVFKAHAGRTAVDPRFDLPTTPAPGGRLEFRGMPEDAKVTPHDR